MHYSTLIGTALSLVSVAQASPIVKRDPSGTNPGSLYSFNAAATARQTFYQYGSCGLSTYFVGVVPDSMPLVAMPASVMDSYGSAQHNTLCGKIVTMTNPANGRTQQAAIADRNYGGDNSIDMTIDVWANFGQSTSDASIIKALNWSVGGTSSGGGGGSGSCKKTYTVVSGDYCYLIWTRFGISEAQLRAWNPSLNAACALQPGQVLCVSQ